ncbi:hypothetical protein [uncultured Thiocystis sp.]|jgi:hypothetical protein|nr:hypothetical protein [uncultured Thiocystis sp.]
MNELATVSIPAGALERLRQAARVNAEVLSWKPDPGEALEASLLVRG